MQSSAEYRSSVRATPLHIQPTGSATEPALFPSEMADLSSIGLAEGNVHPDLLYAADYQNNPYSAMPHTTQEQPWSYAQNGIDIRDISNESYHKILIILANVTRSMNPASHLTGDDMLMTLDTILGQNAIYHQQLTHGMMPSVELQHMLQECYAENQRLTVLVAQQDEENSALQTQVNVLTKEIRSLERSKEKEIQLVADTYREEISSLQLQIQEQERLKDELIKVKRQDLVPKEVQTESPTAMQGTLHLSAFDNKDQSAVKPPPKKPLGFARVTFDLEESKRAGVMETPASSSLATRVVSTVHNNPNIEYDLTTDDMVISQLQESLRQVDGNALQALKINFEQEIAQLKLELEQVQGQALVMIQQSDCEKNQLYTELVQLRKSNEERQFKLEELQRLLCETYDELESVKEHADNERNTRLKLEQDHAEARDRERSAEMIKEHEMELRANELKEENQQLGIRLKQLQFEYDDLRQEYKTVIDLLSAVQGKSLASAVAENAAAELAAIGECAISGPGSRLVPLVESIGLSTLSTAPLIGGVPLIDREVEAQPLCYSEAVQTILIASDVNKEQHADNNALIAELEIALNQTNNALKQRITETVMAEQRIKELAEQLKFKSAELEDAMMEINLLKLELEEDKKPASSESKDIMAENNFGNDYNNKIDKMTQNINSLHKTDHISDKSNSIHNHEIKSVPSDYLVEHLRDATDGERPSQVQSISGTLATHYSVPNGNLLQNHIGQDFPPYHQAALLNGARPDESYTAQASFHDRFKSLCDDSEISDSVRSGVSTHYLEDIRADMQAIKQLIEESTEREVFYASQE